MKSDDESQDGVASQRNAKDEHGSVLGVIGTCVGKEWPLPSQNFGGGVWCFGIADDGRTRFGGAVLRGCEEAVTGGGRLGSLRLGAPPRLHLEAFSSGWQRPVTVHRPPAGQQLSPYAFQRAV